MFTKGNVYKEGTKVWIEHPQRGWEKATIIHSTIGYFPLLMLVRAENSSERMPLNINSEEELPLVWTPQDDQFEFNNDNLLAITSQREPLVCQALSSRFAKRHFYTYCGPRVLIFFNPCDNVSVRGTDAIGMLNDRTLESLQPHIFSVAEKAYRRLERDKTDQSIIFSGLSGSGKTECAKCAILYLTASSSKEDSIKDKILATLTILETFGSVSTTNRCNSSRFGNFFQLQYNMKQQLIGAVLQTYLLDASRVVFQAEDERNFNIFYQLHSVKDDFPHLRLIEEKEFNYINHVNQSDYKSNASNFIETVKAMKTIGLSEAQQNGMLRTISALLYLGNTSFKKHESEEGYSVESCFINNHRHLETMLQLLEVDPNELKTLKKLLCFKRVNVRESEILQPLSVEEAIKTRDVFTRHVYGMIFNWIVMRINTSLRSPCEVQGFIGILDLYGFKKCETNSLEQLWVNYANEKLERCHWANFCSPPIKYLDDSVAWECIKAADNSSCIALLEGKNGIIDILCDKTKLLQRCMDVDSSWIADLERKCDHSKNFLRANNNKENNSEFIVRHFVTDVCYDSNDFIEKNSYGTIKKLLSILKGSKNDFLKKLIQQELLKLTPAATSKRRMSIDTRVSTNKNLSTKTVMSEFRNSITLLLSKLQQTNPYFVRCIKTNDNNEAFTLDSALVSQQLRTYKITEILRMSAYALSSQFRTDQFFQRYHCLCPYEILKSQDIQMMCQMILDICVKNPKHYMFEMRTVFLKEESVERLEHLRAEKQAQASLTLQRTVRRYIQQKRYAKIRWAVQIIQRSLRRYLKRRQLEEKAAIRIQNWVRRWLTSRRTEEEEEEEEELINTAATEIQRHVRGFLARREYERKQRRLVIVQACVRRFLARRVFEKLKMERKRMIENLEGTSQPIEEETAVAGIVEYPQKKDTNSDKQFLMKIQQLKYMGDQDGWGVSAKSKVKVEKFKNKISALTNKLEHEDTLYINWEDELNAMQETLNEAFQNFNVRARRIVRKYKIKKSEVLMVRMMRKEKETDDETDNENPNLASERDIVVAGQIANRYDGMFQFDVKDISRIVKQLVTEINYLETEGEDRELLSPILFMCLRYLDASDDRHSARSLIETYTKCTKRAIKADDSLELMGYRLGQNHRLLNLMKQYSRLETDLDDDEDDLYHADNTAEQNSKSLRRLELHRERASLEALSQWIVERAIKHMKADAMEFVVTSILTVRDIRWGYEDPMRKLLDRYDGYHKALKERGVERELVVQVFERLFSFQSAMALSSFMVQTSSYNSQHGALVRSNVRVIENWAIQNNLDSAIKGLAAITQATRLLQRLPVTIFEVDQVCNEYDKLTCIQISNILLNFRPAFYEKPVPAYVVQAVKFKLMRDLQDYDDTIVLYDCDNPIKFGFKHAKIRFEDVEIPEAFNLPQLKKI